MEEVAHLRVKLGGSEKKTTELKATHPNPPRGEDRSYPPGILHKRHRDEELEMDRRQLTPAVVEV